jgi:selenocysteine-specific elongation factor
MKRALRYLGENDRLGVLDGGLLLPAKTQEALLAVLVSMQDDITVASLRDAVGVNRKCSLAMLDFLDSQGLTKRDGDKRILK